MAPDDPILDLKPNEGEPPVLDCPHGRPDSEPCHDCWWDAHDDAGGCPECEED